MPKHVDVVEAWLAGIRHVLSCPGCPLCLVPDDLDTTPEPHEDDEETLDESTKKGSE